MRTITYPSEAFPGPPSVELDLREGLAPLRVAGSFMAAGRPPGSSTSPSG